MKNIVIFFIFFPCVFYNDLLSQDTLFISDFFIKDEQTNQQSIIRNIKEYKLELDCSLNQRLKNLICNCNSHLDKKIVNGFIIRSVIKNEKQLIIISPNISQIHATSHHLDGMFFIDETPFFVFNISDMSTLLSPTKRDIIIKYYKKSNNSDEIILSNLLDEKFLSEEAFSFKGIDFNLIVENCTKIARKRR